MARTAIISDIHANYHALSAVIEDVHAMGCTDLVCLGDIVGYNAYPSECLDLVRKMNCPVVKGNHDEEVVSPSNARMNNVARKAMDWTRSQLDETRLRWLSAIPAYCAHRYRYDLLHCSFVLGSSEDVELHHECKRCVQ